jgi:hypothetical protein
VLAHLFFLPVSSWRGKRPRPLWLFDRSWGTQATATGVRFVWKDSEDLRHADRQLESNVTLEGRWVHLCVRLWETEALVEADGQYLTRHRSVISFAIV